MTDRALLGVFVREVMRQAASLTFRELQRRQRPPRATIAHGAAGLAYALARERHPAAARWSRAAWAARTRPDACRAPGVRGPAGSIFVGRAGLALVEVLARGARLEDLGAMCRPRRGASSDVMFGAAGALCACAALVSRGESALRPVGDRLAVWLIEEGRPDPRLPLGLAHGAGGIHLALLRWSEVTGFDLPARFFRDLERFARTPLSAYPGGALRRTWCNGSAGVAVVMAAAYRRTGTRAFLEKARAAATDAVADEETLVDLCCGLGGRAYAALALAAIDRRPARRWRARALELTLSAILRFASPWPHGLLRGAPGLVCLARDVASETPRGFPIVEGC